LVYQDRRHPFVTSFHQLRGRGNSQLLCIVVTGKMRLNCTHKTDY
jgi:hypothetical protein